VVDRESTQAGLRAELFVCDVDRSRDFYVEVLGFQMLRAEHGYIALGRPGGAHLGLNAMAALPDGHPLRAKDGERVGLGVELVIMVEDVEAAYRLVDESGRVTPSALQRQPWGLVDFRLQDPDGYYVRVTGLSEAS